MSEEKGGKSHSRRRRHRIRTGDLILVIIFAVVVLLFLRYEFTEIAALLFHPIAGLIVLIVIVQFLWMKSSDRTRIYKLESDRLRDLRRRDEALLRRTRDIIELSILFPDGEKQGRPGDWRQRAIDLKRDIDDRL